MIIYYFVFCSQKGKQKHKWCHGMIRQINRIRMYEINVCIIIIICGSRLIKLYGFDCMILIIIMYLLGHHTHPIIMGTALNSLDQSVEKFSHENLSTILHVQRKYLNFEEQNT